MRDDAWRAVVERIERWREVLHLPAAGLVVVTRQGEERFHATGSRHLASGAPFTPETLFPVGSLTKGFTAVLAAMLVRDGRLRWDDSVRRYLPDLQLADPGLGMRLKISDLFCHRSGLGNADLLFSGNRTTADEIIAQLGEAEVYDPQQPFLYSNINYLLGGEVISRAAGRSWRRLLAERIFEPLLMSTALVDSERFLAAENRATGYWKPVGEEDWEPAPFLSFDTCAAAGGIQATLRDLARWARFLVNRDWARDLEQLWMPRTVISPGVQYGLSFKIAAHRGLRMIHQEGNLAGFSASLGLLPELGIAIALLVNSSEAPLQQRVYQEVWDRVLSGCSPGPATGATFPGPAPAADRAQAPLHFRSASPALICSLYESGDRLVLDVPGQRPVRLEGPNAGGIYFSEGDLSLGPVLLRQPGNDAPQGMILFHIMNFGGLRKPTGASAVSEADCVTVTAADRLPGRYRLVQLDQEVEVRRVDGRLVVEVPGDAAYELTDPAGQGRWLLEPTRLQSLEFYGAEGPSRALTWKVLRPLQMDRIGQEPPPLTAEELLALRRRACGGLSEGRPACLELQGDVHYPHQGIRGTVRWWIAGPDGYRYEEELGRFGSVLHLRWRERVWAGDTRYGQPVRELASNERKATMTGFLLDTAMDGMEAAPEAIRNLRVLAVEDCADRACYRVWIQPCHGDPMTRWICRESGLLLRETHGVATTVFEDFREVAGIPVSFCRITETAVPQPGKRVVEIRSVVPLAAVPPEVFAVPPAAASGGGHYS